MTSCRIQEGSEKDIQPRSFNIHPSLKRLSKCASSSDCEFHRHGGGNDRYAVPRCNFNGKCSLREMSDVKKGEEILKEIIKRGDGRMSKEEKLVHINVAIQSFKVDNSFIKTTHILDTPSDGELGATINKLIHDYKSDFILIRRIVK